MFINGISFIEGSIDFVLLGVPKSSKKASQPADPATTGRRRRNLMKMSDDGPLLNLPLEVGFFLSSHVGLLTFVNFIYLFFNLTGISPEG